MTWGWGLAAVPVLLAAPALAADPPPKAVGKQVEGVTITAPSQQGLRTSIDRKSFSLQGDLQTTTGSVGEALRNIHSVDVDVQGNISLRGDPNVTILIDGKESGLFKGDNRAAALQQLPADQFERVEVITNPSAEFKPDGSGGIINLISKKARKPGYSGSLRATYGSEGRYTAGATGGFNSGDLSVSANASLRHDPQKFDNMNRREATDAAGRTIRSAYDEAVRGQGHILNGGLSADYDLDKATHLGAEARGTHMGVSATNFEHVAVTDDAGGLLAGYDRVGPQSFIRDNVEGSLSFKHKFAGDGHELSASLRRERTDLFNHSAATITDRVPPSSGLFEDLPYKNRTDETELKVDYSRPVGEAGKLKGGYDLTDTTFGWNNVGLRGPSPAQAALDPTLVNHFVYGLTTHAVYGSFERPFGDLTVQAGLRVEFARLTFDQVTLGQRTAHDALDAYPSLHLAYRLSDTRQLTASYSRRIQRPWPGDLDPFPILVDGLNVRRGNTDLKPQVTDSFEAAWQYKKGQTYYLATLTYRETRGIVTSVLSDLGDGRLLTTRANLGERQSAGLELVASGRLTRKLSYNVSSYIYRQRIDISNLGFGDVRTGTQISGRASLNWQVTPKDFIQASGNVVGRQLQAQGYFGAFGALNLGYRHKLTDDVSILVTANDVLRTTSGSFIVDTPTLRSRGHYRANVRAVFVGVTWGFGAGGKRPRDPGFDFGGGPAPGS
jgi:outer membrane receptor protein involved in Fe transport